MKKTTMTTEETREIMWYARKVVENPNLINWISTFLWENIQYDQKGFSESSITTIHQVIEEGGSGIPDNILQFLRENVSKRGTKTTGNKQIRLERITYFIETIRRYILLKVDNNSFIDASTIYYYSLMFNIKYIMRRHLKPTSINELRLCFAVALSQNDKSDLLKYNPELIDQFHGIFTSTTSLQMNDLFEMVKYINNCSC